MAVFVLAATALTNCGNRYPLQGRMPVAPTRVDPARLGAPPGLDPYGIRRGPSAQAGALYVHRPFVRP